MTDTSLTASGRAAATPRHGVSFAEAFRVWLRVAALSFGEVPCSRTSLWPKDVSKVLASSALPIFGLAAAGLIA